MVDMSEGGVANGGYSHVQCRPVVDMSKWEVANGGYEQVGEWPKVDMLMCRAGQWWIYSCQVVVNGGYAHVK